MVGSRRLARRAALLVALLCFAFSLEAQTAPPADSPVGHWIAQHTSQGGIGSWWDFRGDGTLTMYVGIAVTTPITRSGDSFLSPSGTNEGPPVKVTFHVEGDTLRLSEPNSTARNFTRIGTAPSADDPLLGRWKLVATAASSASEKTAMANTVYAFSADGTQSVRIQLTAVEGVWSAGSHTFHLKNQAGTFAFRRSGTRLVLGQPSDGRKTDTYIPDPMQ